MDNRSQTSIENGKKGGRPKGSVATHTLEASVIREDLIKKTIERKGLINNALLDKAQSGDVPAIREVLDRTLGKVTQPIGGDPENPIAIKIEGFNYISPNAPNNPTQL